MGLKSREERVRPGGGPRCVCRYEGAGGPSAGYTAVFEGLFDLKARPELIWREVSNEDLPEDARRRGLEAYRGMWGLRE